MMTVTTAVHFTTSRAGRKHMQTGGLSIPLKPAGRVPRVSRLMALAIRFDGLLRDGTVADQSELARLAHVTQPRMTQIMNLNHLAPDIQEELLVLPREHGCRDQIHEKSLRPVIENMCWIDQRRHWRALRRPQLTACSSNHAIPGSSPGRLIAVGQGLRTQADTRLPRSSA